MTLWKKDESYPLCPRCGFMLSEDTKPEPVVGREDPNRECVGLQAACPVCGAWVVWWNDGSDIRVGANY